MATVAESRPQYLLGLGIPGYQENPFSLYALEMLCNSIVSRSRFTWMKTRFCMPPIHSERASTLAISLTHRGRDRDRERERGSHTEYLNARYRAAKE